jgi:hypothetical protein
LFVEENQYKRMTLRIQAKFFETTFRRVFIFLFLINGFFAFSQEQGEILLNGNYNDQPLQVFFDTLESHHNLRFFYKSEWIEPYRINKTFRNTPLIQALNNIFLQSNLTFLFYQDNGVVIYPEVKGQMTRMDEISQLLIIGNPLNLGRYRRATLKGKVVDGQSGEPLVGAIIFETKGRTGTSTGAGGEFALELPTGDHQMQFSYVGLQSSVYRIRLIEDGYEEFELFEESHAIGEVTVVGKNADLPRSQLGMVQMTSVAIKRLPALMGEADVMRGITLLPGVQTVGELSSGFNVRGGNTDQNLILINGSPVFNSSHLFGFLSLINPDMVENVRLFKGGMPVRLGERVSSVMEVGFRDGNENQLRYAGGIGLINSRLTLDGPLSKNKKTTFIAGGRSSYANWILKEIPVLDLARGVTHFYDGSAKVSWKFDRHNRMSITGYTSNDEFSTGTESVTQYGSMLGNFSGSVRLYEKLYSDVEVAHSRYDYRLTDYANRNPQESYYLDNNLSYSSANLHFRWHPHPSHNSNGGFKAILYDVNPGKITPVADVTNIESREIAKEKAVEFAAYAGNEIEFSSSFSLSAGLRFSWFGNIGAPEVYIYNLSEPVSPSNVTDTLFFHPNEVSKSYAGLEPRVSMRYDLSGIVLKASYQRVHQYLFQLSNNAVASPAETWKPAGYHMKPLISDQVAVGIENSSWMKGVDLTVEMYYKYLQNLVEYKNGARLIMNEHIETALIPAKGFSAGIELSAVKNIGRLTGMASYVFSRTFQKTISPFAEENFRKGSYYPSLYDKPHDFSAVATYEISRRWRFTANFVYISGRPVTLPEIKFPYAGEILVWYSDRNKYRMPSYHRLDASVTFDENLRKKRMWKGSWTLSVYNAYGRENPYSVYYRKSEPGFSENYRKYSLYKLSVIGIPIPSLTYNFKF